MGLDESSKGTIAAPTQNQGAANVNLDPTESMPGDFSYDLTPDHADPETPSNPADVLANRLHSILRILGQETASDTGMGSTLWDDEGVNEAFSPGDVEGGPDAMPVANSSPASGSKGQLQKYAQKKMQEMGMNPAELGSLITLWNKESGWDPTAQNPTSTAFGIAQFLNGTWAGTGYQKTNDPYQQIDAGLVYIKNRYGGASQALQFHLKNNWY